MKKLRYERLMHEEDEDLPRLIAIYQAQDVSQYLNIGDKYFHYVTNTENVYFYKIFDAEQLIGTLHLEKQGMVLFLSVLVFPAFQKMGVGTQIIKDVQNGIFGLAFDKIEISVAETNVASRKLFEKAGFVSATADGALIGYVYEKNKRPL